MVQNLTDSRLANVGANAIAAAFAHYQDRFETITRQAQARFENRDWRGMQADASERLDLYKQVVDRIVGDIHYLLADRVNDKIIWASMKAVYSGLIADRDEWELAETFFNSITRRIFATVGVDQQIEFVDTDFDTPPTQTRNPIYRSYLREGSVGELVRTVLSDYPFRVGFQDLARDSRMAAAEIEAYLGAANLPHTVQRAEVIKPVFYRGKGAYLVGRLCCDGQVLPLVLALLNTSSGLILDAVLLEEDDVSHLFGFTRSYFHVQAERPYDLVHFLKSILPLKRIAELYISIGHNKHGKTELYRDLFHHLSHSDGQFQIARGAQGMVMVVFTLPSYDVVFKIIRDRFPDPKTTTRQGVMDKYRLVFKHDRAGRLVDAQEFEHWKFARDRFSKPLLEELRRAASNSVVIGEDYVDVKHLYVERRLAPLNLFLQESGAEACESVVIDYGNAIRDLACADIFPGDILLKNFGVTRHGRVVFYDYDELTLLTACRFRAMPQPRDEDEELSGEAWFYVADNDFFPEEFRTWLGLEQPWRDVFMQHHADLFELDFWRTTQQRIQSGDIIHIFPYPKSKRLHPEVAAD